MSLIVSENRSVKHEGDFIRFCQEVADSITPSPYWMKNLSKFDVIFTKFKKHNKSHIPILSFIENYRNILEQPIILNDDPNDKWLLIADDEPIPQTKGWIPGKVRGVFLPMKSDDPIHSIPLSEVYQVCLNISYSTRTSFSSVTVESVPAKFLYLFYNMLNEADPENIFFKENIEKCEEMITPVSNNMPKFDNIMGSIMNSDGARGIHEMLSGVANSIDDETKNTAMNAFTNFTQTGDFSSLLNGFKPLFENPGLKSVFSNLTNGMNSSSMTTDSDVTEQEQDDTIPIEDQD